MRGKVGQKQKEYHWYHCYNYNYNSNLQQLRDEVHKFVAIRGPRQPAAVFVKVSFTHHDANTLTQY